MQNRFVELLCLAFALVSLGTAALSCDSGTSSAGSGGGDVAPEVDVAPLEHDPHPTAGDLADDLVAAFAAAPVAAYGGAMALLAGVLGAHE